MTDKSESYKEAYKEFDEVYYPAYCKKVYDYFIKHINYHAPHLQEEAHEEYVAFKESPSPDLRYNYASHVVTGSENFDYDLSERG